MVGIACTAATLRSAGGKDVNVRLEELGVGAPIRFGAQQGPVRILQQRLGVRTIIGVQTDTQAHCDVQIQLVDPLRSGHCRQYLVRSAKGIFRATHFRKQHHELVTAWSADGVRAAHAGHQATCDRLQEAITDRMTQGVVDVLEAVHIHVQHREGLTVAPRHLDRLVEPVVQQHAVGQPGERVVLGQMRHL